MAIMARKTHFEKDLITVIRDQRGNIIREEVRFSLPPTGVPEEFKIIKRPEIPELKDFLSRYL